MVEQEKQTVLYYIPSNSIKKRKLIGYNFGGEKEFLLYSYYWTTLNNPIFFYYSPNYMSHSGVGSSGYHQRTFPLQKSSSSGGRTVTSTIDSNSGLVGNPQHQQPHGHSGLSSTLQSQPYYGESNSFNWKTSSSSSSSRVVQDCFVTPTRVRRATAAASTASAKNPVTSKSTTSSHGPRGGSLFL